MEGNLSIILSYTNRLMSKKSTCQGVVHIRLNHATGNAHNEDCGGSTQNTEPQGRACPHRTQSKQEVICDTSFLWWSILSSRNAQAFMPFTGVWRWQKRVYQFFTLSQPGWSRGKPCCRAGTGSVASPWHLDVSFFFLISNTDAKCKTCHLEQVFTLNISSG